MPRGGGRRGGGGLFSGKREGGLFGSKKRPNSSKTPPPSKAPSPPSQPHQGGGGLGSIIAGSFLGSALGNILGNAIAAKMFEGRDPNTGEYTDQKLADDNPCKKELDYFLDCAKYVEDPAFCKGPSEALKKCAERHKDYFESK